MPNRYLREGILDSDRVNSLSCEAEIFYRRLMSVVDDFGRFDGRPAILKARLYALKSRVRDSDIPSWIAECVKAGLIAVYEVDSKPYVLFHRLGEARAAKSKYPPPPSGMGESLVPGDAGGSRLHASANICAQTQTNAPSSSSITPSIPIKDPPTPLAGGTDESPPKPVYATAEAVPIPAAVDSPEFRTAWADWLADRKSRRKAVTPLAAERQLESVAHLGPTDAKECVLASLRNGWTGIFPERVGGDRNPKPGSPRTVGRPGRVEAPAGKYDHLDGPPGLAEGPGPPDPGLFSPAGHAA